MAWAECCFPVDIDLSIQEKAKICKIFHTNSSAFSAKKLYIIYNITKEKTNMLFIAILILIF